MPVLKIPTPLRTYTNGQAETSVSGGNVGEVMRNLIEQYPTLKPHLYNGDGNLRPFVNLFMGEDNIKDLQGLKRRCPMMLACDSSHPSQADSGGLYASRFDS